VIPGPIAKLMSFTATTLPNQRETPSRTTGWSLVARPAVTTPRAAVAGPVTGLVAGSVMW
jgi:hypothetical protein